MHTILIVERSPLIANDIRDTVTDVTSNGATVIVARDLPQAGELAVSSEKIDVTILSDRARASGVAHDLEVVARRSGAVVVIGEAETIDTTLFQRVARVSAPFTSQSLAEALQSVIDAAAAAPHGQH